MGKRILFVTKDKGTFNVTHKVAAELRSRGHHVSVVAEGLSAGLWENLGEQLAFKGSVDFMKELFVCDVVKMLTQLTPDVLVTTGSVPINLEQRFAKEAIDCHIPVVIIEDTVGSATRLKLMPDRVLTLNQLAIDFYRAHRVLPKVPMEPIGSDYFVKLNLKREKKDEVKRLRDRYDLLVHYAGQGRPFTLDIMQMAMDCIRRTAGNKMIGLILKHHPKVLPEETIAQREADVAAFSRNYPDALIITRIIQNIMDSTRPKVLAVIGARSGSKSIPDKNIKPLMGKPLMAWIIEAAKQAKTVSRVVLSTDSEKYAEVGRQFGAEVPFLRPANISHDKALDIEYLTHATQWFEEHESWKPDIILRLPATSPLCKPEFIDHCVELLIEDPNATSARTVTDASKHPYKLWRLNETGKYLIPFCPKEMTGYDEPFGMPRQLFPPCLSHTDCIAVRYDVMLNQKSLSGAHVAFHKINKTDACDIDTLIDFYLAEVLMKARLGLYSETA